MHATNRWYRTVLYPLVSRLLRHAQGQTLAEFEAPKTTGVNLITIKLLHQVKRQFVQHDALQGSILMVPSERQRLGDGDHHPVDAKEFVIIIIPNGC